RSNTNKRKVIDNHSGHPENSNDTQPLPSTTPPHGPAEPATRPPDSATLTPRMPQDTPPDPPLHDSRLAAPQTGATVSHHTDGSRQTMVDPKTFQESQVLHPLPDVSAVPRQSWQLRARHYSILTRPNKTPARPPKAGSATAVAPAEDVDEADGEAIERVAVESPVEADEPLVLNELEDLSILEEVAELDAEPEEVALALTIPSISPVVETKDDSAARLTEA
ncbi:unnamed protein product, partial [Aureobasidium vineae]